MDHPPLETDMQKKKNRNHYYTHFPIQIFYVTGALVTAPITALSCTWKDLIYNHDLPQ